MHKQLSPLVSTIILTLVLVIGLSLLLYPTVADWWNGFHASRAIASYSETVAAVDTSEIDRMWEEAREYNDSIRKMVNRFQPTEEEHERYMSTLDVTGTGIMGYISIPAINVSLPIYHTVEDTVLQIAVGHIEGTNLPIGGLGTHCVLSGHRGLPSARLFTDLDQLVEGDIFVIDVLQEKFTYEVDQIRIVLPEEVEELEPEIGQDYCTLVTCTPYGVNSHRMLVRGHRIDNLPEEFELLIESDAKQIEPFIVAACIAAPVLLIMGLITMLRGRRKNPFF